MAEQLGLLSPHCCGLKPRVDLGAGAFAGLTITANILMSLVIDKFGLFGMETHALSNAINRKSLALILKNRRLSN
jgi:uncharacterized membrane protein YdcZ (DUF606 family)